MNAPNAATAAGSGTLAVASSRVRLVRDPDPRQRFGLREGDAYRIAYLAGGPGVRRVSRSVVVFMGMAERRRWDGEATVCLEFVLPQGRPLSMLSTQLVDVRAAELNERGQWVLHAQGTLSRRRRAQRATPALT